MHLLLRSSWQNVNIGDVAHTPGVLALLEKAIPGLEVTLWPNPLEPEVKAMIVKRFPRLHLAETPAEKKRALRDCGFFLHGSGPYLVGWRELNQWAEETGKPFGVFGITLARPADPGRMPEHEAMYRHLPEADFVYYRDSPSLDAARAMGLASRHDGFGPDGAFSVDLANAPAAEAFTRTHGLEKGKFLCCIPKLRFTPYWILHPEQAFDPAKHARNEAMKENDHEPLRRAIRSVVAEGGMKILLCPEDRTQMRVGKELLYDRLEPEVRERVVWRPDHWLTDEALSTYRLSAGLFGHEQHSPIMAIGAGIPACVGRWAEQTTKGFMWKDIGLGDWLFDLDAESDRARYPDAVLEIARNPAAATEKALAARARVREAQAGMIASLKASLGSH
ncbi:MAG: polysaccharide pyruvyl transferase family protein [Spirochaetes bacterium]|nr:polysaccharide pyruvyl transferase family protein [Spirochaetota bacterium]